jgi:mannose-6-phosphate isomerase-like protein (cupin superfamily)
VSSPVWVTPPGPGEARSRAMDPTISATSLHAEPGGSVMLVITFPPDAVMMQQDFDMARAWPEHVAELPGIAERFEPDAPGMHRTDTLDYAIILSGEITLELDDGVRKQLSAGDIVVQQGTRHAWRNLGRTPATLAFCMLGRP